MLWVTAVVLIALLQYIALGMAVGIARGRFGISAPATSGHPTFERLFRAHANSLEMLIAFVPGVWLYGWWISQTWATALGIVFIAARFLYVFQYVRDPRTREIGAGLSFLVVVILLVGDLYGVVRLALTR
ncbi:MAG TPA: MAPEG family protein [Steroidobacteraceae bacterium]|jgi:glutathione S-transferase|nr:MAPEG family protein [Steroidobacteraceae bacterium]